MGGRWRVAALLLLSLPAGCMSGGAAGPVTGAPSSGGPTLVAQLPTPMPVSGGAALAVNDVVDVQVFGVSELNRTARVDEAGEIALALIGPVPAVGRSPRELERAVAAAYGASYLQSPQVSVLPREAASARVTVDGAVVRPGVYSTSGAGSLLQVLAQAGGLAPVGDAGTVLVFRAVGEKRFLARFDVGAIRRGAAIDPAIHGGDIVVVSESGARRLREDLKDMLGLAGNVGTLAALGL
ncbi:MAG: polysaccharide biosynthesis protein GumB [Mesorhizobium amorphae]|nr:MAG: polysaccharide biosynthesis protein GumB [Mesorhizobium amorphae]